MTFKQLKNNPIIKIVTNRYFIVLIIFIVWMVFFDENSWLNHREFNHEIENLQNEKDYYKAEIYKDSSLVKKLEDKEELEKFARERYNMKKENEEIFLIEYDTLKKE